MLLKEFVLRVLTFIAGVFLTKTFISGFIIDLPVNYFLIAIIFSGLQFVVRPILIFITLPHNNFSVFVFNFIVFGSFLYFFDLVLPGVNIVDGSIGPYISRDFTVPVIEMKSYIVLILTALALSLFNMVITWSISKSRS